jgi:hypothetical protein
MLTVGSFKSKMEPNGLETKTAGEIKSHNDYLKKYGERNFDPAAEAKRSRRRKFRSFNERKIKKNL